jgi:shikimate dehydrogenase
MTRSSTRLPLQQITATTIERFLAAEFPGGRPERAATPGLAAIGTVAAGALASPLLRDRLHEAGLEASSYEPYSGPAPLLVARSWSLALVLSPFKQEVLTACDLLTPSALETRVVDTLLRTPAGVIGTNTNVYAAGSTLRQLLGGAQPIRALIAGTGASARSVAVGLRRELHNVELGFVGRSAERTASIVAELGFGQPVEIPTAFGADLIVNTTTVGQRDDAAPMAFDLESAFAPGIRYFDLNNRASAIQQSALVAGCMTASGVFMQILTNALRVALLAGPE